MARGATGVVDAFHVVPTKDSAENAVMSDVVGNKDDTVAGDSLIAIAKQNVAAIGVVDAFHDVPTKDSADNATMSDVIGNKTDGHNGDSIRGLLALLEEHFHSEQKVYPELANAVTLTSAGGAWNLGAIVEIIPINTITSDFDIHYIQFSEPTAKDDYEIKLYSGAISSEVLISSVKTYKEANQSGTAPSPVTTAVQPANTRISAAIATGTGGDSIDVAVFYHEY